MPPPPLPPGGFNFDNDLVLVESNTPFNIHRPVGRLNLNVFNNNQHLVPDGMSFGVDRRTVNVSHRLCDQQLYAYLMVRKGLKYENRDQCLIHLRKLAEGYYRDEKIKLDTPLKVNVFNITVQQCCDEIDTQQLLSERTANWGFRLRRALGLLFLSLCLAILALNCLLLGSSAFAEAIRRSASLLTQYIGGIWSQLTLDIRTHLSQIGNMLQYVLTYPVITKLSSVVTSCTMMVSTWITSLVTHMFTRVAPITNMQPGIIDTSKLLQTLENSTGLF